MLRKICALILALTFCLGAARADVLLSEGDKGRDVLLMKQRLQALGYIAQGDLTQAFSSKTAASLRDFQALNGLPTTGALDTETQALLFSEEALPRPRTTLVPLDTPAPEEPRCRIW